MFFGLFWAHKPFSLGFQAYIIVLASKNLSHLKCQNIKLNKMAILTNFSSIHRKMYIKELRFGDWSFFWFVPSFTLYFYFVLWLNLWTFDSFLCFYVFSCFFLLFHQFHAFLLHGPGRGWSLKQFWQVYKSFMSIVGFRDFFWGSLLWSFSSSRMISSSEETFKDCF